MERRRPDPGFSAVAEAARAIVRVPFSDNDAQPLIVLTSLRYPDALGGNAGESFDDYHAWLLSREIVTVGYPMFAADADAAFVEADLLLAMRSSQERDRVYSKGKQVDAVRRIAMRARDPKHRPALAALFGTVPSSLDDVLETAYQSVETDANRWDQPPPTLFGSTGA